MRNFILLILSLSSALTYAQVNDDFSDNDFLTLPPWFGDVTNFEVLNQELHLNAPAVADVSYLVTSSESINDAVWEFQIRMEFNPSSTNYAKFYLVSDSSNLKGPLHGYFVKIGGTSDNVSLFRQNGNTETLLLDGAEGSVNFSQVDISIMVTRDDNGNWELFSDSGSTSFYTSEGTVYDDSFKKSFFSGLVCKYTSTRSDKFFLDNVSIFGTPYVDTDAPVVTNIEILNSNSVSIFFDEPVSESSAIINANYELNSSELPIDIEFDNNSNSVILLFENEFDNGFTHTISVQNVEDLFSNKMEVTSYEFFFFMEFEIAPGDIVLNEFFPDPAPVIELPEAEFVELYNRSPNPVQLEGWKLTDGNTVGTLGSFILLPDSFLILSPSSYASQYQFFGKTLPVSPWPSLNNSGDNLILLNAAGLVIDSLQYSSSWYADDEKEDGGYSTERINPFLDCNNRSNWIASQNSTGGTPGFTNSNFSSAPDIISPQVIQASFFNPTGILFVMDEAIEISSLSDFSFLMDPKINYDSILYDEENLSLEIYLADSIQNETEYGVQISGISDCSGNELNQEFNVKLDFQPPQIIEIYMYHANELQILFDEPPVSTSLVRNNFSLEGVVPSKINAMDSVTVSLVFEEELENEKPFELNFQNLKDFRGNVGNGSFMFTYIAPPEPGFLDILITEVMIDPEPGLGTLPISQYVEIFNSGTVSFSLKGIALSDGNSETKSSTGILEPGEFALLVPSTQKDFFADYGSVIAMTSWPGLNISGELISIKNRRGQLLHQIDYNTAWYKDLEKQDGGWSLEMIDLQNPCGEFANWTSSVSATGGTPGAVNSVQSDNPDNFGPAITSIIPIDSVSLLIEFNEWLDPDRLPSIEINPFVSFEETYWGNDFKTVLLKLNEALLPKTPYTISMSAYDCLGNASEISSGEFYLPEKSEMFDMVINEIMFNPLPGGSDFVELLNGSEKHIMIKDWKAFSFTNSEKNEPEIITTNYRILKPGEYLLLTGDAESFENEYPFADMSLVVEMKLPSLPDDEGIFVLQNENGLLIDSVYYHKDWHHPLLKTVEGVSLERRSPELSSTDPNNWKSASSTSGFYTPGKLNSQFISTSENFSNVEVSPELFFPGTGGDDSFSTITYAFENPDLVASLNIFASDGRLVKILAVNQLLSSRGIFTWDGTDNSGSKVGLGHYFLVFDIFAPDGYKKRIRKKIAVGIR